ncbi:hypothetical protein ACFL27_12675 [candidate division CSSED10-310 bacterium]|uniref:Uncharacterized protein n=1 Tax=candidate division CSSED10-310 bacterium TaxID=2855610 RepID=A0ABV6YXX7_UNCC1
MCKSAAGSNRPRRNQKAAELPVIGSQSGFIAPGAIRTIPRLGRFKREI